MTTLNAYATLAEFKAWKEIDTTNFSRDRDVDLILEGVSRHFDGETHRTFNPRIETRYYSVPEDLTLCLDDDLLEIISATNGDGTSLAAANYNLLPRNLYPKFEVKIKANSLVQWYSSTTDGDEYVINFNAYWGYHERYTTAWKQIGTLGAAMTDTTTLSATMTSGHTAVAGKIYKIDNELLQTTGTTATAMTLSSRGDLGSTAVTHLISAPVYEWQVMSDLRLATLEVAHNIFARRFGEASQGAAVITGAGVVITPKDYGKTTLDMIKRLRKRI